MRTRKVASSAPQVEETRARALRVLSHMRRNRLSLSQASHLEHIKPATVRRYVGNSIERDRPGGRYRASKGDRLRRDLRLPTALGPTAIPVRGSKNATRVAQYLNAVGAYLRTGDESKLKRFKDMKAGPRGQRVELITDPETLSSLAEAGALQLDQLYAAFNAA